MIRLRRLVKQVAQCRTQLGLVVLLVHLVAENGLLVAQVQFQAQGQFDRFKVNGQDLDALGVAERGLLLAVH